MVANKEHDSGEDDDDEAAIATASPTTRVHCARDSEQPPHIVDDVAKQRERRKRNNIASKKSRLSRKERLNEMKRIAATLESENERLSKKIVELERLTSSMKEKLLSRFVVGQLIN